MSKPDMELAQRFVDFLNELVEIDRPAVASLIANRVPCNRELADHPTVQAGVRSDGFTVGLLGLINGLCGIDQNGQGPVAAIYEYDPEGQIDRLQKFTINTNLEQGRAENPPD